jgi:hypothetical protein
MFTITLTEISLVPARHVAIGIHGAKETSGTRDGQMEARVGTSAMELCPLFIVSLRCRNFCYPHSYPHRRHTRANYRSRGRPARDLNSAHTQAAAPYAVTAPRASNAASIPLSIG